MTSISGSAPARSRARAVSYSQFVPGKTGMSARGRADFTAGAGRETAVQVSFFTLPLPWPWAESSGMTGSSVASQASCTESSGALSPPQERA